MGIKELTTVDSSMIHAVGYDPQEQQLEVVFNSGKVYCYQKVSEEIYEELLEADSKGRYMRSCIIDCYPYYQGVCE
ncbi:MAG: KTSC domain-containing protein [Anaerolineales bacterium]